MYIFNTFINELNRIQLNIIQKIDTENNLIYRKCIGEITIDNILEDVRKNNSIIVEISD